MESRPLVEGAAFLCDRHGAVRSVVQAWNGSFAGLERARHLADMVDAGSREKVRYFLDAVQGLGAVAGWELNVPSASRLDVLFFSGARADGDVLVTVSRSLGSTAELVRRLLESGHGPADVLERLLGEIEEGGKKHASDAAVWLEEASRLNNELTNAQRELTKKNARLRHLNEELDRLNQEKNRFVGMAAHDLRGPLGIGLWLLDALLEKAKPNLSEDHAELLRTLRRLNAQMLKIVGDYLNVAAIEAGELRLEEEKVDLAAAILSYLPALRPSAEQKGIMLEFRVTGAPPAVLADPGKIEQAVSNLVSNAIKFSYPGSTVTITLGADGEHAVIEVCDEGQGIPLEEQDQLFKPFGRTSVKSTGGEPNTGLGLMITKRIVGAHGGSVGVESEPGRGSSFRIRLPGLREP
jgi:two-component system, OmpR family, sensor kinase